MKNKEPFFSIVVSAYNRFYHLKSLLQKLSEIDYTNWEVIVIDDGSTDQTASLFDSPTNSHIHYFYQENAERGAARNLGASKAKGDYITFLDSDDYLLADVFIVASKVIQSNPDIFVFHLGYEIRNQNNKLIRAAEVLPKILNKTLIERNVMACIGVFINKKIINDFKFNEERVLAGTEDYELWIRIASRYDIFHFNSTVAILVDHENRSMQLQKTSDSINRIEKFISLSLSNIKVKNFLNSDVSRFVAYRYSYISLHAALSNNLKISILYLFKSISKFPLILFSTRFLIILKKMILK